MSQISIKVPKAFKDASGAHVPAGVRLVEESQAKAWAESGHATILEAPATTADVNATLDIAPDFVTGVFRKGHVPKWVKDAKQKVLEVNEASEEVSGKSVKKSTPAKTELPAARNEPQGAEQEAK